MFSQLTKKELEDTFSEYCEYCVVLLKFKIVKIVKTLVLGRLEDEALDRCPQGEEAAAQLLQAAAAERDGAV